MYNRKLSIASPRDSDLASSPKPGDKEESNTPLKKKKNSSQYMEVESPSRLIKQSNSLMHTHTHTHTHRVDDAFNNYLYKQKHRGEEERSATRASLFSCVSTVCA